MEGFSDPAGYGNAMTDSPPEAGAATRSLPVHRLEFPVDWPPEHVAAYLVAGTEPTLIDTGMAGESGRAALVAALGEFDLAIDDIAHLVLTHPHVDHLGQAGAVIEAGDPTVYVPAGVRQRFERDIDELRAAVERNARAAGLDGETLAAVVDRAAESLRRDRALLPSETVDAWIADGETLDIGGLRVEAIHTPGHQADHLCYRSTLEGERVLFSGDMAIQPFRSVAIHVGLDDGVDESIAAFYEALDRLLPLEIDRVFPGHGPVHGAYEESLNRSIASLDRLVETSLAALRDGASTAAAVADRRQGRDLVYLLPETVGALAYLEATGRAISTIDDGIRRYEPR